MRHCVGMSRMRTFASDLNRKPDCQLQISSGQYKAVAYNLKPYTSKDWQGASSIGSSSASGTNRLGQDVTFTTKLHSGHFSS